jgi:hypothetical protein
MVAWTLIEAQDPPGDNEVEKQLEDDPDLNSQGINCDRGFGIAVAARLLGSPQGASYVDVLGPALSRVPDDPSEQVRMQLPSALLRYAAFDPAATVEILERWLARATDVGLDAVELPRLTYWAGSHNPVLAVELATRMVESSRNGTKATGGNLAAYLAWREHGGAVAAGNAVELLATAMEDVEARVGVALAAADLVDNLEDDLTVDAKLPVGWALLRDLLDDEEERVRDNAGRFVHNLNRSLEVYSNLLKALDDVASDVFFTLRNRGGELPEALLELLERWMPIQGEAMGNPATAAFSTGMHVTELVFDLHAQSLRGSDTRRRCLDIIDRLIELGADEVHGVLDRVEE